jgi:hypothetical protein
VAEGCREEDSQVRREFPVLIPDAMDLHMHLDRSLRRLRMDPRMGILGQAIKIIIAKIQSVLGMNSHCYKPSLGKI